MTAINIRLMFEIDAGMEKSELITTFDAIKISVFELKRYEADW